MKNPFKIFTLRDWLIYLISIVIILASNLFSKEIDYFKMVATFIGATSLIFIAKGHFLGQIIMVVFATFYSILSYFNGYYGEIIISTGLTLPLAISSIFTWIKNPYKKGENVVKVYRLTKKDIFITIIVALVVVCGGFFVLRALNTNNLIVSSISLGTSFVASYLMFRRNSFYAVVFMLNDIVLIVLWSLASVNDVTNLSIVSCFSMFFMNDLYAFISWKIREKKQRKGL